MRHSAIIRDGRYYVQCWVFRKGGNWVKYSNPETVVEPIEPPVPSSWQPPQK